MAIFGVVPVDDIGLKVLEETKQRFKNLDMVKNPFNGGVYNFHDFWLVVIEPLYPPVYLFGAMLWFGVVGAAFFNILPNFVIFTGFIISSIITMTYFLWTSLFYKIMMTLSIWKSGGKKPLFLSSGEMLRVLSDNKGILLYIENKYIKQRG